MGVGNYPLNQTAMPDPCIVCGKDSCKRYHNQSNIDTAYNRLLRKWQVRRMRVGLDESVNPSQLAYILDRKGMTIDQIEDAVRKMRGQREAWVWFTKRKRQNIEKRSARWRENRSGSELRTLRRYGY